MTATQLKAADMVLSRVLPTLQSVEVSADINHNVIKGQPVTADQWASKHVIDSTCEQVSQAPTQALKPSDTTDPVALASRMSYEQPAPWKKEA